MATDIVPNAVSDQGDDDLDSLFGGDDDCSSLFTEDADLSPTEPRRDSRGSQSEAAQLSFPTPSPPEAANRSCIQLTFPSGPITSITSSQQELATRSLPLLQVQERTPPAEVPPTLTFPTVPDPLGAPLSHQDGHTSGDSVVSTQTIAQDFPAFPAQINPAQVFPVEAFPTPEQAAANLEWLDRELNELWKRIDAEAQFVNAQSGTNYIISELGARRSTIYSSDSIAPCDIPLFTRGDAATNRDIRLPARIDQSPRSAEVMAPYITLSEFRAFPSPLLRSKTDTNGMQNARRRFPRSFNGSNWTKVKDPH